MVKTESWGREREGCWTQCHPSEFSIIKSLGVWIIPQLLAYPSKSFTKREFRVSLAFSSTVACAGMVPIKTNKKAIFVEMVLIFACQTSTKPFLNLLLYATQSFPQSSLCGKMGTISPDRNKSWLLIQAPSLAGHCWVSGAETASYLSRQCQAPTPHGATTCPSLGQAKFLWIQPEQGRKCSISESKTNYVFDLLLFGSGRVLGTLSWPLASTSPHLPMLSCFCRVVLLSDWDQERPAAKCCQFVFQAIKINVRKTVFPKSRSPSSLSFIP